MEKFREHEKEYKSNKLTKTALQGLQETESKFMFSGDESGSYGDFDGDFGDSPLSGEEIQVELQESAQS